MTTLASLGITPSAPIGLSTTPGDRKLEISWNAVSDATGYIISYGTSSGTYTNTIDSGNTTSAVIGNLTNNITYYLVVRAYSQPTYYISVSAYDAENPVNESKLVNEASVTLSQISQGPNSVEVSDFPEKTFAFPNLDDEDRCFIATAAYGSSMEPQVILLRKFRNRYLLVNPFGKRLVAAYYSFSPPIADYIRQYRWFKPVVRVILLPFIGLAAYCLVLSPGQQYSVMLAMIASFLAMLFLFHKRKRT
jgi:hypothetical protein